VPEAVPVEEISYIATVSPVVCGRMFQSHTPLAKSSTVNMQMIARVCHISNIPPKAGVSKKM